MSADPLAGWDSFVTEARARLEVGRTEYGDKSFDLPVTRLIGEIRQELLDTLSWTFIAAQSLEKLCPILEGLEAEKRMLTADVDNLVQRVAGLRAELGRLETATGRANHPTQNAIAGCELSPAE